MPSICDYCHGANSDEATKCENCAAPIAASTAATDFRHCPFCGRALLALGSPACSYCGRRLPESFLKARGADLHRIAEIAGDHGASEDKKEKLAGFVGARLLRSDDKTDDDPISDLAGLVSRLFR